MIKKCKYCGKLFDAEEAEDEFLDRYPQFDYYNFAIPLCGECACQAIDMEDTGIYFDVCESCGKTFDYFEELGKFEELTGYGLDDLYENGILCAECAINISSE